MSRVRLRRRRPVPREWRFEHHCLEVTAYRGYFIRGGGYKSTAGGRCDCGAVFGTKADKHNMNAADVREAWMDHVEDAYYGDAPDIAEDRR